MYKKGHRDGSMTTCLKLWRVGLLIWAALFSLGLCPISSQNPYNMSWKKEVPILSFASISYATSYIVDKKNKPLSEAQLAMLNPSNINSFDRRATLQSSLQAETASDVLMLGSTFLPAILLADRRVRRDILILSVMGIESFALNQSITHLNKVLFHRKRPYTYNPDFSLESKMKKDAIHSFYSGHTSYTATWCFYTAAIYHAYHPHQKGRYFVWAGAAIVPAVTGIMRYKAGKHFWTDIISGYISGAVAGILIPYLHQSK